jgi:hypothetical protein
MASNGFIAVFAYEARRDHAAGCRREEAAAKRSTINPAQA